MSEKALWQASTERKLQYIHRAVECGLHSGIPACCIKFYVTKWMWVSHKGKFFNSYWKRMMIQKFTIDEEGNAVPAFQYIPCPKCLKQSKFVNILPCPMEAHCSFFGNKT